MEGAFLPTGVSRGCLRGRWKRRADHGRDGLHRRSVSRPVFCRWFYQVRCLARDLGRLPGGDWRNQVEWRQGDVLKPESLDAAFAGIETAYYLVHSFGARRGFSATRCASCTAFWRRRAHRGSETNHLSRWVGRCQLRAFPHLRSRQETGDALRESGVAVTEFRAGVIVGSGSLSFEMIRYLAERVPVMICPRWVYTRVQPIAITNVLDYLVAALTTRREYRAHNRDRRIRRCDLRHHVDRICAASAVCAEFFSPSPF